MTDQEKRPARGKPPHPEGMPAAAEGVRAVQPAAVVLAGLLDLGEGVSLVRATDRAAARVAQELSAGLTKAEREAAYAFLCNVAKRVRFPTLYPSA